MTLITYRGINRHGTHTGGTIDVDNVVEFVKSKFDARWQQLEVWPSSANDAQSIGQITTHDDNTRVYWAEVQP